MTLRRRLSTSLSSEEKKKIGDGKKKGARGPFVVGKTVASSSPMHERVTKKKRIVGSRLMERDGKGGGGG